MRMGTGALPINRRSLLTLDEAAEYSGLDVMKIRELASDESLNLLIWISNRRYIKRRPLEAYLRSGLENRMEEKEEWQGNRLPAEIPSAAVLLPDGRIKIELYLGRENIRDLITANTSSGGQTTMVNVAISLPQL
jgi:hypothetical protein